MDTYKGVHGYHVIRYKGTVYVSAFFAFKQAAELQKAGVFNKDCSKAKRIREELDKKLIIKDVDTLEFN